MLGLERKAEERILFRIPWSYRMRKGNVAGKEKRSNEE
jgi:hypothetical protein